VTAPNRLLIAERFLATCPNLSEIILPLDVIAREPIARLLLIVIAEKTGATDQRMTILSRPPLSDRDTLRLTFAPFASAADETFVIGALDIDGELDDAIVQQIRASSADRSPIVLDCRGDDGSSGEDDRLCDERGMAVFRMKKNTAPTIRTAYWLDAFWCDASGIHLRGWAHTYEHRLRALRLESAGRSVRVDTFSDRPDLLAHYPDHEHVRHGGFALYLSCPSGKPVSLVFETDAGHIRLALELPHGPIPAWPSEPDAGDTFTPLLRRFVSMVNSRGGRVLQIGSRIPPGEEPVPPRSLLQQRLIGLDIHPGCNVDLVGDAHVLSHFIHERSLGAVLSSSVLEHIQAPWVVAAEVNRVLEIGGLVYQHVPGAWPAHAQPNDFWRFSSEALRVLFGPATGFEILEVSDSAQAAIIPGPDWRKDFLDMPTIPAMAMAEILARKVKEIPPGAVAWPLTPQENETRSHQYPLEGLRPTTRTRQS
jgi:hypothetical protein